MTLRNGCRWNDISSCHVTTVGCKNYGEMDHFLTTWCQRYKTFFSLSLPLYQSKLECSYNCYYVQYCIYLLLRVWVWSGALHEYCTFSQFFSPVACTVNIFWQSGSFTHQMAVPVPSISCCVLNQHNFYQIQNALAFNRDMCCHLALFTVVSFPL